MHISELCQQSSLQSISYRPCGFYWQKGRRCELMMGGCGLEFGIGHDAEAAQVAAEGIGVRDGGASRMDAPWPCWTLWI